MQHPLCVLCALDRLASVGVMVWIGLNHLKEGWGWQWSDGAPLALVNFTTGSELHHSALAVVEGSPPDNCASVHSITGRLEVARGRSDPISAACSFNFIRFGLLSPLPAANDIRASFCFC